MIGRLEAAMPDFLKEHVAFVVLLGVVALSCGALVLHNLIDPGQSAFRQVCGGLIDQVLAGEATRFDYMAARCPAWMLVDAEEAATALAAAGTGAEGTR